MAETDEAYTARVVKERHDALMDNQRLAAENWKLREVLRSVQKHLPDMSVVEALMPDSGELGKRAMPITLTDKDVVRIHAALAPGEAVDTCGERFLRNDEPQHCVLPHGHKGECDEDPTPTEPSAEEMLRWLWRYVDDALQDDGALHKLHLLFGDAPDPDCNCRERDCEHASVIPAYPEERIRAAMADTNGKTNE